MTANGTLSIDLRKLRHNWRVLSELSGSAEASAVVKADAYGLGARQISEALAEEGCATYFVATADEGAQIRSVLPSARIYVLFGIHPGTESIFRRDRLIPVVSNPFQYRTLRESGLALEFAVQVDTGMNRLGFREKEIKQILLDADSRLSTIISHLACADTPGNAMNMRQLRRFQELRTNFPTYKYSLANSAGIFLGSEFCFDITRPGIALYGGGMDFTAGKTVSVVALRAKVLQVHWANAGETVSYGATHILRRSSRLAVAGLGYADGLHRALSGSGVKARNDGTDGMFACYQGQRVPVVGRITMDLTVFDVTDIAGEITEGDELEIISDDASLSEAATRAGTIDYEILTSLGNRYEKHYVG